MDAAAAANPQTAGKDATPEDPAHAAVGCPVRHGGRPGC